MKLIILFGNTKSFLLSKYLDICANMKVLVFTLTNNNFYAYFSGTAWSKDDKSDTITPINKKYRDIGGTDGMTATDIIELNLQYECPDISSTVVIDYVHDVEHRLQMEDHSMKEKLESIEVKLEEQMEKQLNEKMEEKKKGKRIGIVLGFASNMIISGRLTYNHTIKFANA